MLLSQTAEYALRAVAHLAAQEAGAFVPARDLSDATHIPPHYVSKVMRKLVVAELVTAVKGHHGGFRLLRDADGLSFREVIEAVDPNPIQDHCAFGWGACNPSAPCPLHPAFEALNATFRAWAARTTMGDLLAGRANMPTSAGASIQG